MVLAFGILLAFAAMLCWAFGDFLIQKTTRIIGNVQTLAIIGVVGSIGVFPFIVKDFALLGNVNNIILLVSLGVITFITAILDFEALKEGKLSIIDVIFEIELPVTIALSYFFFRELLTTFQFIVIFFVLWGMVLMATKSFSHWRTKLEKGIWIAFASAVLMGVVNFMTATSSKSVSPLMAVWFPWIIFTIITLIIIVRREGINKFIVNIRISPWLLLMTGITDTIAWVFYSFAVNKNPIAIITAITECYPAVAMFLGLWLNKEHIKWHQYLGAGLALAGSIILAATIN